VGWFSNTHCLGLEVPTETTSVELMTRAVTIFAGGENPPSGPAVLWNRLGSVREQGNAGILYLYFCDWITSRLREGRSWLRACGFRRRRTLIPKESRTAFRDRPETVRLHRGIGVHLHPGLCSGSPSRNALAGGGFLLTGKKTGDHRSTADLSCINAPRRGGEN
jgi:hypothetical protein